MSQENVSGTKTFLTSEAIADYLRVKLSGGALAIAGAGERSLGTNVGGYAASGKPCTVGLRNMTGTRKMVAAGAIAQGARIYPAAGGKVNDVAIGNSEGIALQAATANNDVIECMYDEAPQTVDIGTVAALGSTQADAAPIVNQVTSVTAADGTKGVVLQDEPIGTTRQIYNAVATNGLKIYPAGTNTINGGSASAAITIEGKTNAYLVKVDATNWSAIFVTNT
jgi:hypothetical protein